MSQPRNYLFSDLAAIVERDLPEQYSRAAAIAEARNRKYPNEEPWSAVAAILVAVKNGLSEMESRYL